MGAWGGGFPCLLPLSAPTSPALLPSVLFSRTSSWLSPSLQLQNPGAPFLGPTHLASTPLCGEPGCSPGAPAFPECTQPWIRPASRCRLHPSNVLLAWAAKAHALHLAQTSAVPFPQNATRRHVRSWGAFPGTDYTGLQPDIPTQPGSLGPRPSLMNPARSPSSNRSGSICARMRPRSLRSSGDQEVRKAGGASGVLGPRG